MYTESGITCLCALPSPQQHVSTVANCTGALPKKVTLGRSKVRERNPLLEHRAIESSQLRLIGSLQSDAIDSLVETLPKVVLEGYGGRWQDGSEVHVYALRNATLKTFIGFISSILLGSHSHTAVGPS